MYETSTATRAALDAEYALLAGSDERLALLNLLLVAQVTEELAPGAIGIVVRDSDQNLDGTLWAVGILAADGETITDQFHPDGLPAGWEDAVIPALGDLSDENAGVWEAFFVGKRSRRMGVHGFLDVQRILAEVPRPHTPVVVVVRDPDYANDITLHEFDAMVIDVDLGRYDLGDAGEFKMWAEGLHDVVAQLPEQHPARLQVEDTIASIHEQHEEA